jgi:hypothetical protein
MKLYKFSLALMMGIGVLTSCESELDVENVNRQTATTFGQTADELEESVIAAYNHTRMEGTYARVGYNYDVCRGDEVWNSSQVWYLPYDDLNSAIDNEMNQWVWRDWYYTINVCNYILSKFTDKPDNSALNKQWQRIKGQALFLRGLSYYNLAGYYQNPTLMLNYDDYAKLETLYSANSSYDDVLKQAEADFAEAMTLLPTRDEGGQWSLGRVTSGAAAGYYARALMMHPTKENLQKALGVLTDIINTADGGNQKYGAYKLMANYGDNFREGSAYENNAESLYEVQFLDYGTQGTDDEWTPVNTSANATQGHAIESNFGPGDFGGWADLSASPWLYNLFKAEKTKNNSLDPRLYWTIGTYETEWENFEYGNVCYGKTMTADAYVVTNNNYGGLPIAKWTNMRTGLYESVVTGLHCGINLRMMRYSDVLLRAAECENEVNGPTAKAIEWINIVRRRANLNDLQVADFSSADKLFEQIANVERPKEFGCEFGRGFDLIRWGFFYNAERLQQIKEHAAVNFWTKDDYAKGNVKYTPKDPVSYNGSSKSSFDNWLAGHEFIPIYIGILNANPKLTGNSANNTSSNASYYSSNGITIHPVVDLDK